MKEERKWELEKFMSIKQTDGVTLIRPRTELNMKRRRLANWLQSPANGLHAIDLPILLPAYHALSHRHLLALFVAAAGWFLHASQM